MLNWGYLSVKIGIVGYPVKYEHPKFISSDHLTTNFSYFPSKKVAITAPGSGGTLKSTLFSEWERGEAAVYYSDSELWAVRETRAVF